MRWYKIFILVIVLLSVSGCSWFSKPPPPIEIRTIAQERTPLNLKNPAPLSLKSPKWFVVTPDNIDQAWLILQEENRNLVLFAITDTGYQELAISMVELRNFISLQRQIIEFYKEYYEPAVIQND